MAVMYSDYYIVVASSFETIAFAVNLKLAQEWHPLGGISAMLNRNGSTEYAQAVVKVTPVLNA